MSSSDLDSAQLDGGDISETAQGTVDPELLQHRLLNDFIAQVSSLGEFVNRLQPQNARFQATLKGSSSDRIQWQINPLQTDRILDLICNAEDLNEYCRKFYNDTASLESLLRPSIEENRSSAVTTSFHFPQFTRLPVELRKYVCLPFLSLHTDDSRIIWRHSFHQPQILTIIHNGIYHGRKPGRSQVNITAGTCKEARETLLELKLDFFDSNIASEYHCYFNPEIDTLFCLQDTSVGRPAEFSWMCSRCEIGRGGKECKHKPTLHKLVISWNVFTDMMKDNENNQAKRDSIAEDKVRWFKFLCEFSPLNLVLFLDENRGHLGLRSGDLNIRTPVVFIRPPEYYFREFKDFGHYSWRLGGYNSWKEAEDKIQSYMMDFVAIARDMKSQSLRPVLLSKSRC